MKAGQQEFYRCSQGVGDRAPQTEIISILCGISGNVLGTLNPKGDNSMQQPIRIWEELN